MTAAAPRLSLAAALALLGVALGATLLVLGLGSWPGTYYSLIRVVSIVVAFAGIVIWLGVALVRPAHRPSSGLMGAFAAALFAFAISAFNAPNVRLAIDFLGYAVLLTALYLLFVRVWTSRAIALRLEVLLAFACLVSGVLFIAAMVNLWATMWSAIGAIVMPPLRFGSEGLWTGTPNAIAAFQVLLYCGVVTSLLAQGRRGRIAAVALGLVVAVDVALSGSRGAWLGVAMAVLVTGTVWLATTDRDSLRGAWSRLWTGRTRLIVIAGAVMAVIAASLAIVVALPRLSQGGGDLRSDFISASIRMFQAAPLTGQGPGSWAPDRLAYTDASEIDYYVPHAHNVPAQTVAEFGLVGVVAGIIVVVLVLRLIAGGLRRRTAAERALALAALFACVYITGQQLVDAWIHQPAILFALAVPIARLDAAMLPGETPPYPRTRRLLSVVLLVAVFVGTGTALWSEPAAQLGLEAIGASEKGDWQEALDKSSAAVTADPRMPPFQLMRGLSAAHLGDMETARDAFAAATADDLPASWINLAAVQLKLGDTTGAAASLDRGTRLGIQQPVVATAAAGLYHELGDDDNAARMLAAAFTALPSLSADALWRDAGWAPVAAKAVDAAVSGVDQTAAMLVALEAGRFDTALAIAKAIDPDDRNFAQTTVAAWTGDQPAFEALHAAARADPLNAPLVAMCRRVARIHDPTLSTPGWACDGGWYFGDYPVATIGSGRLDAAPPGADEYWQGLYGYRRPNPTDLLVPWVLHIQSTHV